MIAGSASDAETNLRAVLGEAVGMMVDTVLLGSTAATSAAPAGLLSGVSAFTPVAGGGSNAMIGDVKLLTNATAPNLRPVLIANPVQAASLNLLANNPAGVPVLVTPLLAAGVVVMVDAAAFASAVGVPSFRSSQSVTLHENDVPLPLSAAGTPTTVAAPMRSNFQTDCTALRSIVPCDWALRRTGAVAYTTGTTW